MKTLYQILKSIVYVIFVVGLTVLLSKSVYSQEKIIIDKKIFEFAKKSLNDYVNDILNEDNCLRFNFKSLEEARSSYLGEPYKIVYIDLNSLKAYKSDSNLKSIVIDPKIYWFPVLVKEEIRTKLEIVEKEDRLIAGEFGGIRSVNEIALTIKQLPKLLDSLNIKEIDKSLLLKVPVMYASFLYIVDPQGEYLIPTMIHPQRFELQNRRIYKVEEILPVLKEYAIKIDGNKLL